MKFTLVAALAAVAAAPAFAYQAKGFNSTISRADDSGSCKFGSGAILSACGGCAQAITDCVKDTEKGGFCLKQIKDFADECGGCAVDILECLHLELSTTMKFTLVAALAAIAAAPAFAYQAKGFNSTISRADDPLACKFGSGKILDACGTCAKTIVDCVNESNKTGNCLSEIKGFAEGCGGCAVDLLECL
ncbi:hypothetical protein MCUN1_001119 [Malassezia cuniculi]|uniref:Uncharacterized protein n=1 Tax=Malassezia cuniculi TaxID=948313 RepID=A0AAF0EWY9_9BASI|nr:hypothetical protein MCUN1_001119 [Malassezia cuniculi]